MAECMRLCFDVDLWEEHEASMLRLRRCRGTYLTKRPMDLMIVRRRLRLDGRFGVICMARDPRDVVVSKHGSAKDGGYFPYTSAAKYRVRWHTAQSLLEHPRFLLIRYEDPDH